MHFVSNRITLHEMSNTFLVCVCVWRGGNRGIYDPLTFTTLWAKAADDELVIVIFYPENRIRHFTHFVSNGDNLHEKSNPVFFFVFFFFFFFCFF